MVWGEMENAGWVAKKICMHRSMVKNYARFKYQAGKKYLDFSSRKLDTWHNTYIKPPVGVRAFRLEILREYSWAIEHHNGLFVEVRTYYYISTELGRNT